VYQRVQCNSAVHTSGAARMRVFILLSDPLVLHYGERDRLIIKIFIFSPADCITEASLNALLQTNKIFSA
jgi:hypothetical protein